MSLDDIEGFRVRLHDLHEKLTVSRIRKALCERQTLGPRRTIFALSFAAGRQGLSPNRPCLASNHILP